MKRKRINLLFLLLAPRPYRTVRSGGLGSLRNNCRAKRGKCYSVRAEAGSMILPKKIAFMNNLLPPSQKARKFGLSAIEITLPLPDVLTTTAAEFFTAS